jgi:drug/metabolite transporter (DMT)-like permease
MFFIIATILLNVVLSAIFKLFPRYRIDALQAIVANYVVCVATGAIYIGRLPYNAGHIQQNWFPWALLMGVGFISLFNLIAMCTRVDGITTTTIANKLSLVIPVLVSVLLFNEHGTLAKFAGIGLALPAVYLATRVKEDNGRMQGLFYPALLFVGSGLLDTLVNYVQRYHLPNADTQAVFTIYCFSVAGCVGLLAVGFQVATGKTRLHWRNLIAGICVGIPNYFSIYFLIRALNSNTFQSSATIPVINIGILIASALAALLFFREKVSAARIVGLVLSVVAILLIILGDK